MNCNHRYYLCPIPSSLQVARARYYRAMIQADCFAGPGTPNYYRIVIIRTRMLLIDFPYFDHLFITLLDGLNSDFSATI